MTMYMSLKYQQRVCSITNCWCLYATLVLYYGTAYRDMAVSKGTQSLKVFHTSLTGNGPFIAKGLMSSDSES